METDIGRAPAPRRQWLHWIILLALIIIVIAAILFWALRPGPSRNPVEFLPATTQAAIDCDLRPGSPGLRQALREWGVSDVKHLGQRATELAQQLVNWSGFDLDVRKDLLPWFGGELVLASVARQADRAQVLGPDSFVLIARTTSMRRARASLEEGVRPFARDAYWHRTTENYSGEQVTVWFDGSGRPQLAYATKDGCVLIAKRPEVIDSCLSAAQSPANRLSYQDTFSDSVGELSHEAIAWAYGDVASLAGAARAVLPGLRRGWPGVIGRYRSYSDSAAEETPVPAGVVAFAVAAKPNGAEVSAAYRSSKPGKTEAKSNPLARVAKYAPPDAILAVALHHPGDWLEPLLSPPASPDPQPGRLRRRMFWRRNFYSRSPEIIDPWLGLRQLPSDLMVAILPRENEGRPALAVAAPAGELPVPPRGLLSFVFPRPATAVVDNIAILATDEQALKQCSLAAKNPRPLLDSKGAVRFVVSARPSRASAELSHVQELAIIGRQTPQGGEGKITLAIPPRYLLGGG